MNIQHWEQHWKRGAEQEQVRFFLAENRKIRVEIWKIYPQLVIISLGIKKFDRQLG